MPDVPRDAEALIDEYGRYAAGQAFTRALDCALADNIEGEAHWLSVATLVMEMQGRHGELL
jgi:hypothetical protein